MLDGINDAALKKYEAQIATRRGQYERAIHEAAVRFRQWHHSLRAALTPVSRPADGGFQGGGGQGG